ncbi:MAG: Coenzyme F420 hydrogenase/dehydrogenase, beta subunit C-terminal domain [Lachnospiraceae bacterium]|nr:Coenzyme F420 hydrogenase/dehydrogenase, beta subunit C-terminal domain [Lachnospiraceae bacterium]
MIGQKSGKDCCGCGACVQACPRQCIQMNTDEEGFWYPQADKDACISCGRCEAVCPMQIKSRKDAPEPKAYGGWNRDEAAREKSSSGGAFPLFAEYILENGGTVYGAAIDEKMKVAHRRIASKNELECLQGSKYVESDIGDTYLQAKEDLKASRKVLFTGTPCQIAGLKTFLGREYDLLYTVDFTCHGVPSPLVFEKYVAYLNDTRQDQVTGFLFRNKVAAWKPTGQQMGTIVKFASGKEEQNIPAYRDPFMNGFLSDLYLRKSCYECPFKPAYQMELHADITIADFWGVHHVDQELNNAGGTSLILLNSSQGEKLFEQVSDGFEGKEIDFAAATRQNRSLYHSAGMPSAKERAGFFDSLQHQSFNRTRKRYMTGLYWAVHKFRGLFWK